MNEQIEVRAPAAGIGADAYVTDVFVSVGQKVAYDQAVVCIETHKGNVEVPSPAAGRVTQILIGTNSNVKENALLIVLDRIEDELKQPSAAAKPADLNSGTSSEFHASPWIRGLAREKGINLGQVRGTGRHGRILEEDLELPAPATPPAQSDAPPSLQGSTESRPLSRLQCAVGRNLAENWAQIPHVTQFDESDITELEAFRLAVNLERQKEGAKLSLLPFIVKATACALSALPEFNSSLSGEQLILKRSIHIGFAVDTEDGLRVPVIQHADRLSVSQIAGEITRLAQRARVSKLTATDVQGGSFTISNLGGAGGTAFTPIINAPEVAILGVSKAQLKPKWDGSSFVPRLMLPLSLSYDHRVINGVAGARFVSQLGSMLSDLRRTLL